MCVVAVSTTAQSGVLIAAGDDKPNEKRLSLAAMNVDVLIDNQFATVRVVQIFENHTAETLEGKYIFALPQAGSVSDFAVWDNETRIPGVMLERRRAMSVYAQIKQPKVDPGLLLQTDESVSNAGFSTKVYPINAYGTKRVEMEYTESLPVLENWARFTFPLKPSNYFAQRVGRFSLQVRALNDSPIEPLINQNSAFPMQIIKSEAREFDARFAAENIELTEDFAFDYKINQPANELSFIAYRAPERISTFDLRDPATAQIKPDGYFEAAAIFNQNDFSASAAPRRTVILLDTSLSMHGEKLQRAVEAVDFFLHYLRENDCFNLILFNREAVAFSNDAPVAATADNIERALQFVRDSTLGGNTDLRRALEKGVASAQNFGDDALDLILISDGNPTAGTIDFKQIENVFAAKTPIKLNAFAVGADADAVALKSLAEKTGGLFVQARETEDSSLVLRRFLTQIGQPKIENLRFYGNDFYDVYQSGETVADDSSIRFVGRYKQPKPAATINVFGNFAGQNLGLSKTVALPEFDDLHDQLPRIWARARVDALLQIINRDGEREDLIAEIIRLSQKYKFITPYTAFLAAPRALLRPRLIQPGDPVIRVKTDAAIKSVFAVLPFGETLPLKFLPAENVWETRFLAPAAMPDGTYSCRLLLTDGDGNGYEEAKTFVVDSHAPKITINLPQTEFRAGQEIALKVASDADTNRLTARIYGVAPVSLQWSNADKTNVGKLLIPANLSAGKYVLTVTAEDFAHNQSTTEMPITIY